MSAEAWYPVASNDVFPEEFGPSCCRATRCVRPFLELPSRSARARSSGTRPRPLASRQGLSRMFSRIESARFRRRFTRGHLKDAAWQID